jgi:hypothetical protein
MTPFIACIRDRLFLPKSKAADGNRRFPPALWLAHSVGSERRLEAIFNSQTRNRISSIAQEYFSLQSEVFWAIL